MSFHFAFNGLKTFQTVDWDAAYKSLEVDQSVLPVDWAKPGTSHGLQMLESFCNERLKYFGSDRNNPNKNALSNLSPWIHFGMYFSPLKFFCYYFMIICIKNFKKI